ncbi:ABC transporter ATP-binding protein [Propioniciclava soli]|uniref:ABC transporter ATP-binding protein n=1 Tax=Propioniciclava soli TaxID=2775081 RepID=UPI001E3F9232
MSVLECRGLGVRRGEAQVVHDLDLVVDAGAWVAVVGPNGAGKTSLLHGIAALTPVTGHLRLGNDDPHQLSRRALARRVALMAQQPVVPTGMTVRELVALGRTPFLRRFGTESATDRAAVQHELTRLGLATLADRPADRLSGGELQRVMLARALCQQPTLLLLDEPTSALDIGHQQSVLDLVDEQRHERGLTVLAAMHDLTLAAQYADRMVLLDRGVLVQDGPPADVLDARQLNETYGARVDVLPRPAGPAVIPVRPVSR